MTSARCAVLTALSALLALPGSALAQETTPVTIEGIGGFELKGSFYPAAATGPGALLLHMCNAGDRTGYDSLARRLQATGFHVLSYDHRGHGESRTPDVDVIEDPNGFWDSSGEKLLGDADRALSFLAGREEVDGSRLCIVAASCAVSRAALLARDHPGIRALVLLSGNVDDPGREYLKTRRSPPLFGAAAEDDGEGMASAWIREILAGSPHADTRGRFYPSGGHGTDLLVAHPELEGEIADWLHARIGGPGTGRQPAGRWSGIIGALLTAITVALMTVYAFFTEASRPAKILLTVLVALLTLAKYGLPSLMTDVLVGVLQISVCYHVFLWMRLKS